jgi:hypothetical protein
MVSGAGMAADVWTRLDRAVKAKGGVDEDLHLLARDEGQAMIDQIADLLVKAGAATRNAYPVTVNYAVSLADMIVAGKYDYANEYITATNFPIQGEGEVNTEVVLVHFNRDISSEAAVTELAQMGLEPAKLEHLLAFGSKFPEIQREFPIVALGSSWVDSRGGRRVPCLGRWYAERRLFLYCWDGEWPGRYRFAAVRKS